MGSRMFGSKYCAISYITSCLAALMPNLRIRMDISMQNVISKNNADSTISLKKCPQIPIREILAHVEDV